MSEQKVKVGDVVRLKSDGPRMTVNGEGEAEGKLECVWFDTDTLHMEDFAPEALEIVEAVAK